jgi:hypothetical protein
LFAVIQDKDIRIIRTLTSNEGKVNELTCMILDEKDLIDYFKFGINCDCNGFSRDISQCDDENAFCENFNGFLSINSPLDIVYETGKSAKILNSFELNIRSEVGWQGSLSKIKVGYIKI